MRLLVLLFLASDMIRIVQCNNHLPIIFALFFVFMMMRVVVVSPVMTRFVIVIRIIIFFCFAIIVKIR